MLATPTMSSTLPRPMATSMQLAHTRLVSRPFLADLAPSPALTLTVRAAEGCRLCTFTRIDFDGQSVYRFGVGTLSAALSTNTYFTIANGLLKPEASAPTTAGAIYFELRGTGNFVEGNSASFGYVDVVAKKVSVAA